MKSKANEEKRANRLKLVYTGNFRSIFGFVIVLLIISPFTLAMETSPIMNGESVQNFSNYNTVSAEVPTLNLTYTTRTNLIDKPVVSDITIAGDHVKLKAIWTPAMNRSRLEVHAPAIPSTLIADENETSLEIDTRYLGNNATCTIIASTWLANGTMISKEFLNVYIGNFFVPLVRIISPNGGESWTSLHNITWTASDVNIDDELFFDVLVSDNLGTSFDTLATSINQTWFEWDCSNLDQKDTYIVEVRATDSIYFSSDRSDTAFSAGSIPTSTTPTETTTTTTTHTGPTGIEPRILAFVAILLISSGVMALVVYYAARKWF